MFLDRPDTWILLAMLYGIMACMLLALWAKNRYLSMELEQTRNNNKDLIRKIVRIADALDKDTRRERASRSHREHMLEEKLKRQAECYEKELKEQAGAYEEKLTMWECKYETLKHTMQGMWPGAKEARGAND